MLFTERLTTAVRICESRGMSYAVVFEPHCPEPQFFACDRAKAPAVAQTVCDGYFVAGSFGKGKEQRPVAVYMQYGLADILAMGYAPDQSYPSFQSVSRPESTDVELYRSNMLELIGSLQGRAAKVVLSRQIAVDSDNDFISVANKYFEAFPDCFRALYCTGPTGRWIVATPEILLTYDCRRKQLATMSLAGTRLDSETPWDAKNLMEHQLVTDYIVDCLSENGINCEVSELEELKFGPVEHLCNHIKAHGEINPLELAVSLSPTPAVCGWPVEEALEAIGRYESHSRGCYGGFIGVSRQAGCDFYVNLRSCKILGNETGLPFTYVLYAGGGVNYMSDPDDEWREAELKITPLKKIITEQL